MKVLAEKLSMYDEELHVIMEATVNYHLPIACFLKEQGYIVQVINPLEMKRYRVAMFAAYNKFLRIYHARVSEVLNELDSLA